MSTRVENAAVFVGNWQSSIFQMCFVVEICRWVVCIIVRVRGGGEKWKKIIGAGQSEDELVAEIANQKPVIWSRDRCIQLRQKSLKVGIGNATWHITNILDNRGKDRDGELLKFIFLVGRVTRLTVKIINTDFITWDKGFYQHSKKVFLSLQYKEIWCLMRWDKVIIQT